MAQSKAFSEQRPRRPHLLRSGGFGREIDDARKDLNTAFNALEKRDPALDYPELDWIDITTGAPAAAGGDVMLKGRNLLQGQTFASLTIGTLDFIACIPGVAGNDYTVTIVDTGGGGLTVTLTGTDLVIDQGGSASTEDQIATAMNNALADTYQVIRGDSGGGAAPTATAIQNLSGGAGGGWSCTAAGLDAPIKHDVGAATSNANLSETEAILTVPALTGTAAGDFAAFSVTSDDVMTQSLSCTLA